MRRIFAFVILGVVSSCAAKKAGPDKLADVQGFCNEWATRACNATVVSNCSAASSDKCIESQQTFCEGLIPDGKYSEAGAGKCLDAVQAAYSDAVLTATERDTVVHLENDCSKVLSGSAGAGDACKVDSDCNQNDGLACATKGSAGTCEKPQMAGAGEDCSAAEAVCATGFYCDASSKHCLAAGKAGNPCSATLPCNTDTKCIGAAKAGGTDAGAHADGGAASSSGASTSGTCQARAGTGATCKTDDDCTSQICSGSGSGSVCSAKIILAPAEPICANLH